MLLNYFGIVSTVAYKYLCIFRREQKKQKKNLQKCKSGIAWKITKSELLAWKSAHVVTYARQQPRVRP